MQIILARDDIVRILHDMTLAHVRQFFLHTDCLNLSTMPPALRQSTAASALDFFNLDIELLVFLEQANTLEKRADIIHDVLCQNSSYTITFRTSGSTGVPCACSFSVGDLMEEVQSLAQFFADIKRVVAVVPAHHVYGFSFALMLPKFLDIPVLHLHPLMTSDFFGTLQTGDAILAFPLFWASVLKMSKIGISTPTPDDLRGITSGAPCTPDVIEGLCCSEADKEQPFLSEMTEIYGATEFGAVGMRRDCRDRYVLLPHWRRVQIKDNSIEKNEISVVWGICRSSGKGLPMPDILDWKDERHFIPVKRKDKVVQISSINVLPARIADILRSHPQVHDCAVRLMRPDEGDRLKAFVVPANHDHIANRQTERHLRHSLKTWLATRIEAAAIPKSIVFGASLPVTQTGKAADWKIL
jgi:4-coumarate--CoA ligase (photoactive yellow protein activation family)